MSLFPLPDNPSGLEQYDTALRKRFVQNRLLTEEDFLLLINLLVGGYKGVLDLRADLLAGEAGMAASLQAGERRDHAIADNFEALTRGQQAQEAALASLQQQQQIALANSQASQLQAGDAAAENRQWLTRLQHAVDARTAEVSQLKTLLEQQQSQLATGAALAANLAALDTRLAILEAQSRRLPAPTTPAAANGDAVGALAGESAAQQPEALPVDTATRMPTDVSLAPVDGGFVEPESAVPASAPELPAAETVHAANPDAAPLSTVLIDEDIRHTPSDSAHDQVIGEETVEEERVEQQDEISSSAVPAESRLLDETAASREPVTEGSTDGSSPSALRRLLDTLGNLRGGSHG